ncbi:MAG: DUF2249 domain-containing protein [Planctomycetes bacterium]|nr:DUF2249 domain-containing protein [Planctomycetota bacterium]
MPQRLPAEQRRPQIADAILQLLATNTVDAITTRRIAEVVGISQPALFRHFPSRDDLLVAAVDRVREFIGPLADQAILRGGVDGIRFMATGMFERVSLTPGLPRLLFFAGATSGSPTQDQCPKFNQSLRLLVSMQRNLVAELLRDSTLELNYTGSPDLAARIFVGLMQGTIIQRRFGDVDALGPAEVADLIVNFWLQGLHSLPEIRAAEILEREDPQAALIQAEGAAPLQSLDVRPVLEGGVDPLSKILQVLEGLPPMGVLQVTAPFKPTPLISLLEGKGHRVQAHQVDAQLWILSIFGQSAADVVDLREMEAPEPMEQCLLAAAALTSGGSYLAMLPRIPQLLLPRLEERGIRYQYLEQADATALIWIGKP